MPRLLSKSLLLTVLLVLLASCVQYRSLSEGAEFDASKGTAIVVMGVALGEITDRESIFSSNALSLIAGSWQSFDAATGRLNADTAVINFRWRDEGGFFGVAPRFQGLRYFVFELDAGSYILTHSTKGKRFGTMYGHSMKHHYVSPDGDPRNGDYSEGTLVKDTEAPRFSVSAGEVVYIGDFHFSGSVKHTRIDKVAPNIDAAQAYLRREFPDIKSPLQHRPPRFSADPSTVGTT